MMRWFGSGDRDREGADRESTAPPPVAHKSLALNVLAHQFREGKKYSVLDLGPAIGANVEFFSQFSCRLHIEDLYETLNSFDYMSPEDGFSYDAVFKYLLPFPPGERFDFILTWDLLNYLERQEFGSLIRHLSRHAHRGTMLFSLISTNKHISEVPYRFSILDSESLLYELKSTVLRVCPQYRQTDLQQLMPGFRVCNSFILRNGFKEYLFQFE